MHRNATAKLQLPQDIPHVPAHAQHQLTGTRNKAGDYSHVDHLPIVTARVGNLVWRERVILSPAPDDELLFPGPNFLAEFLENRPVDGRERHVAPRARVRDEPRRVAPARLALLALQRELGPALYVTLRDTRRMWARVQA